VGVRQPGKSPKWTDEKLEHFEGDLSILTPEQRRHRRYLRSKTRNARAKAQESQETREQEERYKRLKFCTALKSDGTPCHSYRLKGSDKCVGHQPAEVKANWDIGGSKPKVKAPEAMRLVVESAVKEMLKPYLSALGLYWAGMDDDDRPVIKPLPGKQAKGIVLHGESRDGDIVMTEYPDIEKHIAVVERLLDRVYGKPRITTVLEGGREPVKVQPVRSAERAQEVADILARNNAIPHPHEGRQRRDAGVRDAGVREDSGAPSEP
jgi:hypothetical protein